VDEAEALAGEILADILSGNELPQQG
jgi:hypothetical protein